MLALDEIRKGLDAVVLPKNAGIPGCMSSNFGVFDSARESEDRRQLALDLGLAQTFVIAFTLAEI